MKKGIVTILIIGITIGIVYATTWFETKEKCPICNKINKFQEIGSYGSYIYQWPEKLEYIFWPVTETNSLYSCSKCKYSSFMWDFNKIGKDTLELIKKELPNLNLSVSGYKDKMTKKLEAAEKIYKLYNNNSEFWCKFYRIMGYHYSKEGNSEKAKIARLKALFIADSLLNIQENVFKKKEYLLITSSMKHFTNQDSSSINDINLALTLTYIDSNKDSTKNANINNYFDGVLTELKNLITNNK